MVFALHGHDEKRGCKRVYNGRTGCSILACPTGRSRRMKFQKGTSQCRVRRGH
jgi:hypothetical protein